MNINERDTRSWFCGICNDCGFNLIVTQGRKWDYWWYCSNKECKNHHPGEDLSDQQDCSFQVTRINNSAVTSG